MLLVGGGCLRKWLLAGSCGFMVIYMLSTIDLLPDYNQLQSKHQHDSNRVVTELGHSVLVNQTRTQSLKKPILRKPTFGQHVKQKRKPNIPDNWRKFSQRRKTMTKACFESYRRPTVWTLTHYSFLDNLILDSKTNWMYCSVLKAGSTFWKRVIGVLSGNVKETNPYKVNPLKGHKYLSGMLLSKRRPNEALLNSIVFNATSFMFSRDPYARLFSAYIDKIFTPRPFYRNLRESILRIARPEINDSCAIDVTFPEFMKYVVYSLQYKKGWDRHFLPMTELCRPCNMHFDFLGKMETFRDDAEYILSKMNPGISLEFTKEQADLDSIDDMVQSVFFERTDSKDCIPFGQFLSIIWQKAIVRGILSKNETMPATFLTDDMVTEKAFRSAMLQAYKQSAKDKSRSRTGKQALKEAFRTVSKYDLRRFRDLFKADFQIFGYDMFPNSIFSETDVHNKSLIL